MCENCNPHATTSGPDPARQKALLELGSSLAAARVGIGRLENLHLQVLRMATTLDYCTLHADWGGVEDAAEHCRRTHAALRGLAEVLKQELYAVECARHVLGLRITDPRD